MISRGNEQIGKIRVTARRQKQTWTTKRNGRVIGNFAHKQKWTYLRKDVGRRGRGKKVIPPLKEGLITKTARNINILLADETLLQGVSIREIPKLARALIKKYGYASARGKAMSRYVLAGGKNATDRARSRQRDFFKTLYDEIVKQGRSER